MGQFKMGKKAPRRLMSTPAFGDFLTKATEWPAVAPRGWEFAIPDADLEMLGNDQYGDCAEAGAMHLAQLETANTGNPLHATLQQTLDLYKAVVPTFDPNDPATDEGTDLLSLLQYWKAHGIPMTDKNGKEVIHQILGWASLDLSSVPQMRYANDLFGGTYLGVNLPKSAEDDTSNWVYVPSSPSVGGHCIPGAGQGGAGTTILSWGMKIPTTWEFMLNQLDEGYIVISPFWLDQQGKSPSGLDLDGLLNAAKAL